MTAFLMAMIWIPIMMAALMPMKPMILTQPIGEIISYMGLEPQRLEVEQSMQMVWSSQRV